MTISTLKDLERLVRLMRKEGVQAIKVDGIELELGVLPTKAQKPSKAPTLTTPGGIDENVSIPTDFPTAEELLNWSVTEEQQ